MTESPCPGRCNTNFRKARDAWLEAVNAYDPLDPNQSRPVKPDITAIPGDPWCGNCKATIRRELGEIGRIVAHMTSNADGYAAAVALGERISGTPGHRSPSPEFNIFEELDAVFYGWECSWWKIRFGSDDGAPDRRGFLADKFTDTIVWIIHHWDGMIRHPDIAVPLGEEIRDWHRSLRNRTKTGTGIHTKTLRCPGHGCGQLSLTWREGDTYVRCVNRDCGQAIKLADYEDMEERAAAALPVAS